LTLGVAPAQTINYSYNERDWLTQCTSSNFWEHLGYNLSQEIGGTAQWNGNISWSTYFMNNVTYTVPSQDMGLFPPGSPSTTYTVGYRYTYDKANRLLSGNFGGYIRSTWGMTHPYNMPAIGYDSSGNIKTLQRYGSGMSLIDNLSYSYAAEQTQII